ncbi:MAG TPA: hypothetical protein VF185_02125 [Patescibacteria group bacterium]
MRKKAFTPKNVEDGGQNVRKGKVSREILKWINIGKKQKDVYVPTNE